MGACKKTFTATALTFDGAFASVFARNLKKIHDMRRAVVDLELIESDVPGLKP